MKAQNEDALAVFGLTPDSVEEWEDGYRTAGQTVAFEWWYVDAQLSDGSAVVVTFSTKPHTHPDGPLDPTVLIIHRQADGTRLMRTVQFPEQESHFGVDRCDVRIGPNTLRGNLAEYDLHVEADGITVDLHIDRVGPSWRPGAGVNYYDKAKTTYLAWVVPVPYGTATGTVALGNAAPVPVAGGVYHDHNWGNALMGDYLDHWYWGRAHIGEYTVIYAMLTTKRVLIVPPIHLPVLYVCKGDTILVGDGLGMTLATSNFVDGPGGHTYPQRLEFAMDNAPGGKVSFTLTNPALIEVLNLGDDTGPDWARALKHMVSNPMYYDFTADMSLTVHVNDINETVTGATIFERMMFR